MGTTHRSVRRTVLAAIAALTIGLTSLGAFGLSQAAADEVGTTARGGKISRELVLKRARTWLGKVWYSQSSCYPKGSPPCQAPNYRQDCSGYVSMAWNLPFSRYTGNLREVMHRIPRSSLKPGDVLFRRDASVQHVALFIRWNGNSPVVWEEYSTGHTAEQRTWSAAYASTYTPYRYNNIVDKPKPTKPKPTKTKTTKPQPTKPKPTKTKTTKPQPTKPQPTATKPTATGEPTPSDTGTPGEPTPSDSGVPSEPVPSDTPVDSPMPTSTGPELPKTGVGPVQLLAGFGAVMTLLGVVLLWSAARQRYRGTRRAPV